MKHETAICVSITNKHNAITSFLLTSMTNEEKQAYILGRSGLLVKSNVRREEFLEKILFPVLYYITKQHDLKKYVLKADVLTKILMLIEDYIEQPSITERAIHILCQCLSHQATFIDVRFTRQFMRGSGIEVILRALQTYNNPNNCNEDMVKFSFLPLLYVCDAIEGKAWLNKHFHLLTPYVNKVIDHFNDQLSFPDDAYKLKTNIMLSRFKENFKSIQTVRAEIACRELLESEERDKLRQVKKREKRKRRKREKQEKYPEYPNEKTDYEQLNEESFIDGGYHIVKQQCETYHKTTCPTFQDTVDPGEDNPGIADNILANEDQDEYEQSKEILSEHTLDEPKHKFHQDILSFQNLVSLETNENKCIEDRLLENTVTDVMEFQLVKSKKELQKIKKHVPKSASSCNVIDLASFKTRLDKNNNSKNGPMLFNNKISKEMRTKKFNKKRINTQETVKDGVNLESISAQCHEIALEPKSSAKSNVKSLCNQASKELNIETESSIVCAGLNPINYNSSDESDVEYKSLSRKAKRKLKRHKEMVRQNSFNEDKNIKSDEKYSEVVGEDSEWLQVPTYSDKLKVNVEQSVFWDWADVNHTKNVDSPDEPSDGNLVTHNLTSNNQPNTNTCALIAKDNNEIDDIDTKIETHDIPFSKKKRPKFGKPMSLCEYIEKHVKQNCTETNDCEHDVENSGANNESPSKITDEEEMITLDEDEDRMKDVDCDSVCSLNLNKECTTKPPFYEEKIDDVFDIKAMLEVSIPLSSRSMEITGAIKAEQLEREQFIQLSGKTKDNIFRDDQEQEKGDNVEVNEQVYDCEHIRNMDCSSLTFSIKEGKTLKKRHQQQVNDLATFLTKRNRAAENTKSMVPKSENTHCYSDKVNIHNCNTENSLIKSEEYNKADENSKMKSCETNDSSSILLPIELTPEMQVKHFDMDWPRFFTDIRVGSEYLTSNTVHDELCELGYAPDLNSDGPKEEEIANKHHYTGSLDVHYKHPYHNMFYEILCEQWSYATFGSQFDDHGWNIPVNRPPKPKVVIQEQSFEEDWDVTPLKKNSKKVSFLDEVTQPHLRHIEQYEGAPLHLQRSWEECLDNHYVPHGISESQQPYVDTISAAVHKNKRMMPGIVPKRWNSLWNTFLNIELVDYQVVDNMIMSDNPIYNLGTSMNSCTVKLALLFDGTPCAVKKIPIKMFEPVRKMLMNITEDIPDSIHIVPVYGIAMDEHYGYISMELCDADLDTWISEARASHSGSDTRMAWEFVQSLRYLHEECEILHMNIKPRNILLDAKGHIKLSDYGIPSFTGKEAMSVHLSPGQIPSCCWHATEFSTNIIKSTNTAPDDYTQKSEIQVAGMLIHYILSHGHHPFGRNLFDIQINISRGWPQWQYLSEEANDLLRGMLSGTPEDRISLEDIVSHPFFWSVEKKCELLLTLGHLLSQGKKEVKPMEDRLSCIAFQTIGKDLKASTMNSILLDELTQGSEVDNNIQELLKLMKRASDSYQTLSPGMQSMLGKDCRYFLDTYKSLFLSVYRVIYSHSEWVDLIKQTHS